MSTLSPAVIAYLEGQPVGRLATAGTDGRPHVVPVSFRFNSELGTIDSGGFHVNTTKRFRDVQANPHAAIVVDDLVSVDPWTPRMVEIRGRAEALDTGGADLHPGFGEAMIRIHLDRVNVFGIE
jgi:pyridoxamine 5'-phosphate oxidase family protein